MDNIIYRFAKKVRPDLESLSGQQRMSGTADVLTLLYTLPMLVIGLVWLVRVSSWESIRQQWMIYLLMGGILYIFNRLRFFFITEIRTGGYANSDGSMDGIAIWAAVLLLGPTALWLKIIWNSIILFSAINREKTTQSYWSHGRMFTADVSSDLLATLVALVVYRWAGGVIPIRDYSINSIAPAFLAIIIQYIGTFVIYSGYIAYIVWSLKHVLRTPTRPAISFFIMAISLPALANPFGILVAGIYTREGIWEFIYILLGLLVVAILARRLSQSAENSRQQSRQIEQLEKLGRAILDAPPDGSDLPVVLQKHVSSMFSSRGILIWTDSRGILLQEPMPSSFEWELAWKWLQVKKEVYFSMPGNQPPWNPSISFPGPVILCPIEDVENGQLIGEIFIELQTMTIPWDARTVRRQLPAVQSLAAQVASAIHQAHVYTETLSMQKTLQELSLAHSIQASFLPESVPQLPGWQLTATLEPARQIAGDFYDFIHLPEGKLGILIADVADKGLGSALYMALSSTLIRTFADEYHRDPAMVMKTVNQHILRNARANLFVTVFFAVLDPTSGVLCYANAGHNPPFLLGMDNGIKTLNNTGMPLGIDEENEWGQNEILISPGEILLMYTDGVTDAQNNAGEFIDRKLILSTFQQNIGKSVQEVQQGILDKIHHFVGDAPRFDDLTLVILGRESPQK
jgi:serine phosphatase RsbU (regulator of sigma subunit)